jgi:hypothetical protein
MEWVKVSGILLALFLLGTLVLQVSFYPPAHAQSEVLSDGFESGNFNAWTGTVYGFEGAGNPPEVQSSITHSGTYAMNGTVVAGEGYSDAYESLGTGYATLYVRCYGYVTVLPNSGDRIRIGPMIEDTSITILGAVLAEGLIYNNGGTYEWCLGYYTDSAGGTEQFVQATGAAIAADTWYSVEVAFSAGSGTGFSRMFVNGVDTVDANGLTNDNAVANHFEVGAWNFYGSTTFYSNYVDDVVAATGPIGLAFENMMVSTTQAGASCTFSVQITDSVSSLSMYIFGTNNTGTWVNDSAVAVSGSTVLAYATKTLSSTVGVVVGYEWFANDTSDVWESSGIRSLTTSLPWFSMSRPSSPIVGNPSGQHGFDVVHTTNVVKCSVTIDGAVRTYLAYDTDPPAGSDANGRVRLYYSDGIGGPWTPYSLNPIMGPLANGYSVCSVALVDGTFHMVVNNVALADVELWNSTDGVNFTLNETILTAPNDPWTNPFIWLNPNDAKWYLFWEDGNNAGNTWSIKARNSTSITDLASQTDTTVMSTTTLAHMAFPTVMYRDGYYWLLCEAEPTNLPPWEVYAFVSGSVTSGYVECSNSPIITGDEACPQIIVGDDGVSCYLFTNQNSNIWLQVVRAVSPRYYLYLMLSVDPDRATYTQGQSITFDVSVLNELSSSVNSTLTLSVTGPGGYGYFDFDRIKVTSGLSEHSFAWTVPNVLGTYVVEVSLVPLQLTAYDAAWLGVK